MNVTTSRTVALVLATFGALAATACGEGPKDPESAASVRAPVPAIPTAKAVDTGAVVEGPVDVGDRGAWNRAAAELALPVFWTADANANHRIDPSELATYWGLDAEVTKEKLVKGASFTREGRALVEAVAARAALKVADSGPEADRKRLVAKDLAQGRVTLVATDLTKASEAEKAVVRHVTNAATVIERLYAMQMGTAGMEAKIPAGDTASKTLFFRTHGPRCEGPLTQDDPACVAFPGAPKGKVSGLYPQSLLGQKDFCTDLGKKDKALVDPFTVVTADPKTGALTAVPYHVAYKTELAVVASELRAAAKALGEGEPAFRAYLGAAADAFEKGTWFSADEAWAKMSVDNSKFYLRIAPDEVYSEPCSTKALFHVSFGLVNQGSVKWQKKLDPKKTEMEAALAKMAGAPYTARPVTFHLPDFVDIALNAGDSRNAFGATIGQSLPNFGPVANEGRGRTVAMTNFYTDADSVASLRDVASSLLCKATMAKYTDDVEPGLMSVVLHEAAHNLGPAHQYKVAGKIDRDQFGGPLASTLEELKAQSAALYFTDWLAAKNEITKAEADLAHVRDLTWAFGHISRGMFTDDGHPKNYSQLAAIQLGWLMNAGAVAWKSETAANGKDEGCFDVAFDAFPKAVESLMGEVAKIKGRGDKTRALALVAKYVECKDPGTKMPEGFAKTCAAVQKTITERVLRAPKPSFVYAIQY
ncbi:MAG: hypothetical protein U0169_05745 [Polyangiaceae bacterium]